MVLYVDRYACNCEHHWGGDTCEGGFDACVSVPCRQDGTCTSAGQEYTCRCQSGFEGDNCERDVNECEDGAPCSNDGVCINRAGSFVCLCQTGWTGETCDQTAIPCTETYQRMCDPNFATCRMTSSTGYECTCVAGFVSGNNGRKCEETDPCADELEPCQFGSCKARQGIALCTCDDGYVGDACDTDVDDCASSPCRFGGDCVDAGSGSGYTCSCNPGYFGTECHLETDECGSSPCFCDAVCTDNADHYVCSCPPGWGGENCNESIEACPSAPCRNGGVCSGLLNQYVCDCTDAAGWTGENCEEDINECRSLPCLNGGECTESSADVGCTGADTFACVCPGAWGGELCELPLDTVDEDRNPLIPWATCPSGSAGVACADIDDCHSSPCKHGSVCMDGPNDDVYTCTCADGGGFTGDNCEADVLECSSNPCSNGACAEGIDSYGCLCRQGFSGCNCLEEVDECASTPCRFGGACNPMVRLIAYEP